MRLSRPELSLAPLVMLMACSLPAEAPLTPVDGTPVGDVSIERVIFLLGDAGESPPEGSPLFTHLQSEVEAWSAALAADSAVAVIFLGDNVYPNGVHARGHPDRVRDSLRLSNQIDILRGPEARRHTSPGIFLAGNHDWGGRGGPEGEALLRNQEEIIRDAAATGVPVDLLPPALDPGPEVLDLGPYVKLVTVDTQWWLQNTGTLRRSQALQQVKTAVMGPSAGFILFAAHHPLASGGPHGGNIRFWPTLGAQRLLNRTGSIGQDLSALPYQNMISDFRDAFSSTQAGVIYAAGHEHGLQVIRGTAPNDPEWILVSGSGSKRTNAAAIDGTQFVSSAAGFMRLLVSTEGTIVVEVVAETESGFETVFVQHVENRIGNE
jgi:hypothetical protein